MKKSEKQYLERELQRMQYRYNALKWYAEKRPFDTKAQVFSILAKQDVYHTECILMHLGYELKDIMGFKEAFDVKSGARTIQSQEDFQRTCTQWYGKDFEDLGGILE